MQLKEYEAGAVGNSSESADPTDSSRPIDPGSGPEAETDLASGAVLAAVEEAIPGASEVAVLDGQDSRMPPDTGSPFIEDEPEAMSPGSAHSETAGGAAAKRREDEATRIVRTFLKSEKLEVLFNSTLRRRNQPPMTYTQADIDRCLSLEVVSPAWLIDKIMVDQLITGRKLPQRDIERAFRIIARQDSLRRKVVVGRSILQPLSEHEAVRAARDWQVLVEHTFETNCSLAVAILQHFIWQVKRKLLGMPVSRHLMPIVYSPVQGSGKTTFVTKLLGPLQELAIKSRISEFVDPRNIDIYRFPVLVIDDMERIQPSKIPNLKDLMANEDMSRRPLRTSGVAQVAQSSTLIGTANNTVDELVSDRTGNRRFVGLPFRNGEVTKGGDPCVWKTVDSIDYLSLWRSVDTFGPSPIEPHLEALTELQEAGRVIDELEAWLRELDLDSPEVKEIVGPHGAPAGRLFELFRKQTGSTMSKTRFGTDMNRHAADPALPFGPKRKVESGTVYPIKPRPPKEE